MLLFSSFCGSFSSFVRVAVRSNNFFNNFFFFCYNGFGVGRFFSGIAISFGVATIAREEGYAHNNSKR